MENTPLVKLLAGTILVHAQKPPRGLPRPSVRMTEHRGLHGAISVVVPCYNEEMNLGPLVEGLLKHYDEYIHEIILVDDNSKDRSRQVMRELAEYEPRVRPLFRQPPNGVGLAISEGMKAATGRYVLSMDCDFLHILPELRDMFDEAAAGADVVLGSRFSRSSVLINYPIQKILCNRSFHLLLSLIFRRKMRDVTNNLKLMRAGGGREPRPGVRLVRGQRRDRAETDPDGLRRPPRGDLLDQPHPGDGRVELLAAQERPRLHQGSRRPRMEDAFRGPTPPPTGRRRGHSPCRGRSRQRGLNRSGHSFGTRAFPLVHDRHFTGSARLTSASGTRGARVKQMNPGSSGIVNGVRNSGKNPILYFSRAFSSESCFLKLGG